MRQIIVQQEFCEYVEERKLVRDEDGNSEQVPGSGQSWIYK